MRHPFPIKRSVVLMSETMETFIEGKLVFSTANLEMLWYSNPKIVEYHI